MKKSKMREIQRELLNKYYQLDGKTARVELHFETFSELVDSEVGDNSVEKLNGILFEKIDEALALIPRKFDIELDIRVRDFGDYTEKEGIRIIRENLVLKIYALVMENSKKRYTSIGMLAGGVLALVTSYFLGNLNWPQIIYDIFNITGTLLIWEAASRTFIERNDNLKRVRQYVSKIRGIEIRKDGGPAESGAAETRPDVLGWERVTL